ncbi:MAG: hypothetical protein JNM57_14080 [Cyclobacteriaceae bacterium]|nr:hypothetical protein [Cyclobacteriaceae bacterium]
MNLQVKKFNLFPSIGAVGGKRKARHNRESALETVSAGRMGFFRSAFSFVSFLLGKESHPVMEITVMGLLRQW